MPLSARPCAQGATVAMAGQRTPFMLDSLLAFAHKSSPSTVLEGAVVAPDVVARGLLAGCGQVLGSGPGSPGYWLPGAAVAQAAPSR